MADTGTGRTLYSGTVSINVAKVGTKWTLTDVPNGGHKTYAKARSTSSTRGHAGRRAPTRSSATAPPPTAERRRRRARTAPPKTWGFYKNTFGRLGIRGDGVGAYSRVHFGTRYENAFWDDSCFCMTYGDGYRTFRQLVALDVAGHEMSHGVTSRHRRARLLR